MSMGGSTMLRRYLPHLAAIGLAASLLALPANATEKKYDPGVTDQEIKIGNLAPYSGPASAYGIIGRVAAAFFRKVNDEGGINGRKITFISYDDAFSPPKAVEQARKLVESDEVLMIYQSVGTPSNAAIQKFLNARKVPQLFVASNATRWGDPEHFPWTMGWQPNFQSEGRAYAKYILQNYPNAKIAMLWQNDDGGRDEVKGLRDGLREKASMIVAESSFELSEPTIDAHISAAEKLWRGCFRVLDHAESKRSGHPQARRTRVEAGRLPRRRLHVRGECAPSCRSGERQRDHLQCLFEGPQRSRLEQRRGHKRLECVHR